MHVVFGASGRAGGETARALIECGELVRVAVRRPEQGDPWKALGAQVAVADLGDADTVTAALTGATTAFLLNPPPMAGDPFAQAAKTGAVLAEAVRRAGLSRAVVLSSIGAQHASGFGAVSTLHRLETALTGVVPAATFLRSGYFAETWTEAADPAIAEGILPTFLDPEQKIPMVSTIDVGYAAARLMRENWTGTRIVELSGPEDWSARDVAAAFADVLGHTVQPTLVPPERRAAVLAEAGLPTDVADVLLGMYDGITNGRFVRQDGNEHWRGKISLTTAVERIVAKVRAAG
ncbi:NmrA family NAD(P)-binding protein [Nitratireductor sp. GCM10026969]|uniref:NmrA family NAD(P)-binding protein n=1 Tax=Nitratireductor sp. GCM10026969 TaxID=3252645 RepID=UPI0036157E90